MTSQKSFQLVHQSKFNCNRIQSDNSRERAVTGPFGKERWLYAGFCHFTCFFYICGDCQFLKKIRSLLGSVLSLIDALQGVPIVSKTNLRFSPVLHERSPIALFLRFVCRFSLAIKLCDSYLNEMASITMQVTT